MAKVIPGLRDAITEAVEGADESEATAEAEGTEDEALTPDASDGGLLEGETDDGGEGTEAAEGTDPDAPTEYFGIDLSGLEPEQRVEIINELRKRDDHIGKLLRERVSEEAAPEGEPEPVQELTDEDILAALGLDPESPFDEQAAKVAIPLVRNQLEQQQMLSQLIEAQELAEIDRTWRTSLSGLEREFGPLPEGIDHDRVMEYAASEGLAHPLDAYWRIMGPGRAAAASAAEAAKAKTEKLSAAKRSASSTRPSTSTVDADALPEAKTTRGATREVARKLLTELGLDL